MENAKITYNSISGMPDDSILDQLTGLYTQLFPDADVVFFKDRLKTHKQSLSVLAYSDSQLVGFKIGYPYKDATFYSWIGGVLPKFRRLKIATELASLQETYARSKGFTKLRTKSMNQYRPMMIFNLKNGFDIVQVYTNTKKQTKVVFEKAL